MDQKRDNNLLSIIVPVFNAEKTVKNAINSILSQGCQGVEIVVVDDGSTDDSFKVCKEFTENYHNIKVIKQKNSGSGVARNKGLDCSTGDYVLFLDSDDFYLPDSITCIIDAIKRYECDVFAFDFIVKSENGEIKDSRSLHSGEKMRCRTYAPFDFRHGLYSDSVGNYVWSYCINSALLRNNHISFPERGSLLEDAVFIDRVLDAAQFVRYIGSTPLYCYVLQPDSLVHKKGYQAARGALGNIETLLEKHRDDSAFLNYIIKLLFFCDGFLERPLFLDKKAVLLNREILGRIKGIAKEKKTAQLPLAINLKLVLVSLNLYNFIFSSLY